MPGSAIKMNDPQLLKIHKLSRKKYNMMIIKYFREIQCVPRSGFGSGVCVHRRIAYVVSQSADLNHFRGTVGLTSKGGGAFSECY